MIKMDFNQNWTVQKDGNSEVKQVNLPHDAMIYEERSKDSITAGACGYFKEGKYSYTKRFEAPLDWNGKNIILECEAVYQNSAVFINGKQVAEHPYGYTNFFVNLTDEIKYGEENTITIIADNSKAPNSRWYSGSGVYREVQLYVGQNTCIMPEGVKVTVVDEKTVTVDVEMIGEPKAIEIEILLDGKVIASASENHATIIINHAKLWSAETPVLYQCKVVVTGEDEASDASVVNFGIRTLSWSPKGFFVNGEKVLLRGGCIHHDNGILGAAAFKDAEWRRVKKLKDAGFNAIRSAHNPLAKAALDACDALGMYVMDESFDMWIIHKNPYDYAEEDFRKWWNKDLGSMVSKDYNHPSVIMYSIGNEISELGLPEGQILEKEQADFVHAMDATRPVTLGINLMLASMAAKGKGLYGKDKDGKDKSTGSAAMDTMPTSTMYNVMMNKMGGIIDAMASKSGANKAADEIAPYLDIQGYNYATSRYKKDAEKHPDRVIVGSETLPQSLYKNWQLVKSCDNLIGDFMWTSWDYLGESGIGTVRYTDKKTKKDVEEGLIISGGPGIIDICGKERTEVEWGRLIWDLTDKPAIGVNPVNHANDFRGVSMWRNTDAVTSWSWEGYEGVRSDVVVYAKDGFVELFVNKKSVGRKKTKGYKAIYKKVMYEPGEIEVVAYDTQGKETGRRKMVSATGKTSIALSPDKLTLIPNGQDLCYIDIDLVGENGVTKSSVDTKLHVDVEGAGVLQAFGSARPNMAENFYSTDHTTYYGKALLVVRAGMKPGKIKVTVSGANLESQVITVEVK